MNELAVITKNAAAINMVYNTAYGQSTTLNEMVQLIKNNLCKFDPEIANVNVVYGTFRNGDIPHSLASIQKAQQYLNYNPQFSFEQGLQETIAWYWENLKNKD